MVWNMFKVSNENTTERHWSCSGLFIVNFKHILPVHVVLGYFTLILNSQISMKWKKKTDYINSLNAKVAII